MLGRSMGGGVTYNALVAKPGLVEAAVVFAPVSSDFVDNFNRWTVAERPDAAAATYRRYGTPQQEPGLLPRAVGAHLLRPDHRAGADPPRHRRRVLPDRAGRGPPSGCSAEAGVDSRLEIYEGEQHAFGPQWPLSMERTVRFLRRQLRG